MKKRKLLRLNKKGIEACLSSVRKDLEAWRFAEWPEGLLPSSPPMLTPLPQLSIDWFEDSGELEEPQFDTNGWNSWPEVRPPKAIPMLVEYEIGQQKRAAFAFLGLTNKWVSLDAGEIPADARIIRFRAVPDYDPTEFG